MPVFSMKFSATTVSASQRLKSTGAQTRRVPAREAGLLWLSRLGCLWVLVVLFSLPLVN